MIDNKDSPGCARVNHRVSKFGAQGKVPPEPATSASQKWQPFAVELTL